MNLDEALAVRLLLKELGYPNKDQRAALAEAESVIAQKGAEAIARFNSAAPGSSGPFGGVAVMTEHVEPGSTGGPANS